MIGVLPANLEFRWTAAGDSARQLDERSEVCRCVVYYGSVMVMVGGSQSLH